MRIAPFHAVRPDPYNATRVAAPPYDVVSTAEARQLAAGNPDSFLHVTRPEIDLPPEVGPYDDAVYAKARENYDRFKLKRVLQRAAERTVYLYRQVREHVPQIGVTCCCHVDDYTDDVIRKHEKTRVDKEDDRTRHVLELNAHAEPVFLTYRDQPVIDELVERDTNERPMYHFNAPDGVTHTAWMVRDPQPYVDAFKSVPVAYVADGHHRSASAARAGAERRQANASHTGAEEYNWFLTVLFPASQLHILAYNRVIADLADQSPANVLEKLRAAGKVEDTSKAGPERPGEICFYMEKKWRTLTMAPGSVNNDDPIRSLDVSLLQERVLEPIFGIRDQRTDERIDFVGGIRGTQELERRVDSGNAAIAFSLRPTTIDQLMAVSDAGLIMPPKSTWFEPKLRSGLFVHELD
jgi:uncharacterized protein (DUF1015 family)